MSPEQASNYLVDRAQMMSAVRSFFSERNVLEVDVPALAMSGAIDPHIDPIPATLFGDQQWYLHTSPEYGMKKLLARGSGDIYQLSHVFRDGELGERHRPEFMMLEWYRCNTALDQLIIETCSLCSLFVGAHPILKMTYQEAMAKWATLDDPDLAMATEVEPNFTGNTFYIVTDYPYNAGALARTNEHGCADRFEVFFQECELANGYHELIEADEQERRLHEANALRQQPLPIDNDFLAALKKGLPDCCGVAVGFDRLMMLRHNTQHIADILPLA